MTSTVSTNASTFMFTTPLTTVDADGKLTVHTELMLDGEWYDFDWLGHAWSFRKRGRSHWMRHLFRVGPLRLRLFGFSYRVAEGCDSPSADTIARRPVAIGR